jgi:N utilization substance protein A
VDDKERVVEVVVEDKQLSLAIGKKGQNVRLAAKLTGWRIDIKSEDEKRREVEAQLEGFEVPASSEPADPMAAARELLDGVGSTAASEEAGAASTPDGDARDAAAFSLPGIGDKTIRKLIDAGFDTSEKVAAATIEALSEIQGIGDKTAERILASARGESPAAGSDEPEKE